tara:strand:+ start:4820 stop:6634 length:1815 start_codon:yes stop_codon:yes gene_type:complete
MPGAGGMRPTVAVPGLAVRQGPSDADIMNALRAAAGHHAARRFPQAAELTQKVLHYRPDNADAMHLLGLIAFETGKLADGERLIAMAVKMAKVPSANMYVNLGNAQREQAKLAEALKSYDLALARDPLYADAFFERGILRTYERNERAAIADFERVMELQPERVAAYARAAEAMVSLGLYREAMGFCERIMERDKGMPALMYALKASIHERLTELDEAIAMAEKALAFDPTHLEASRIWARATRRRDGSDADALQAALKRLDGVKLDGESFTMTRSIYDERAQIYDKLKDYDQAFANFTAMNDVAEKEAQETGVDKNDYLKQVEDLAEAMTPERVASWSSLGPLGVEAGHRAAPVFLVGFPRSGTTLLDQIIDAHPDFQVIEEMPLLRAVRDAAKDFEGGYPASLATLTEVQRGALREIYWRALKDEGADVGAKIIVDKMPLNLIHVGLIARVFPEAKIILALRHPADCVLSCFMQNFQLNGSMVNFHHLSDAARLYDRVMVLWNKGRELLPLQVHEVRYEHLIKDLQAEVEPLLTFLGAGWDEVVSDPAAHALARGTIRTPSYAQVTQPIYGNAADRWRRYEKFLAPALSVLEPHIRRFGYGL